MIKLKDILDVKLLAKHVADGNIAIQKHPRFPLYIYNYTPQTQYGGIWDDVTSMTRGLIVDSDDNVLARPFRKFHNINTSNIPATHVANIPAAPPEVTEKLDGSLGILYNYGGKWYIATRGSFASEQALWATEWFQRNYLGNTAIWDRSYTALFEIIYPQNRIVVKYDYSGLVMIGLVGIGNGKEYSHAHMTAYSQYGIKVVKKFNKRLTECMAENAEGTKAEGYVLFWPSHSLRLKVKFADYVRLHRLLTGVNPIAVWEILRDGRDIDQLVNDEQLPQEFKVWLEQWKAKILLDFKTYVDKIDDLLKGIPGSWDNPADHRRICEYLKFNYLSEYASLAIAKLCNKQRVVSGAPTHLKTWEYMVWSLVRPKNSKTFKVEE